MAEPEDVRTATSAHALRAIHAARARSAQERAAATCRHAGIGPDAAETVPKSPVGRAAHALLLSAASLDALTGRTPDPAADARCARNAAAAAALAAQVAHAAQPPDGATKATEALRTALAASQAAAVAAGGTAGGRNTTLNTAADEAETRAGMAAREAGWTG
ncbi:hypothetical protein [Streptomyces olivochromogenes]|uniref:hypothetical protein n=1 Tax=Streptomyces olivochromogenes TaxID=1963 RepID=UPI001F2F4B95|nr:hypothetical protein [Streptomyces olivochromogenes]MCF3129066.1 hypothetical protein [Streptomyces olivochromogenes]